jgi:hypothetical protein
MEPENSSPYPQVPATCPYHEPTPSSPHDPLQLPQDLVRNTDHLAPRYAAFFIPLSSNCTQNYSNSFAVSS